MAKWPWILGGIFGGGVILLLSSTAQAAPRGRRQIRISHDEDLLDDGVRKLGNFCKAANIDAKAYQLASGTGYVLGIQPGARFVVEDSRALPMQVNGIDVVIKGWPR